MEHAPVIDWGLARRVARLGARDLPDRTTYGTMRIAFENLLYPYRAPEKMF